MRVTVAEGCSELTVALVVHNHRPLSLVRLLGRVKLHMQLHDLEWLQAESRFNFLLKNLGRCRLRLHRMFGARVGLGLDDFKWSTHAKVEGQVRLRVIREGQLLDHVGCFLCGNGPLLDFDLFAAIKSVRLVDAQLWADGVSIKFERNISERSLFGTVVRVICNFYLFLRKLWTGQEDGLEVAHVLCRVESHCELLDGASIDQDLLRLHFEGRIGALVWLLCGELEFVGHSLLVKALVLDDIDVEQVVVNLVEVALVKDSPVNLK